MKTQGGPRRVLGDVATVFVGISGSRLEGEESIPVLTAGQVAHDLPGVDELGRKLLKRTDSVERCRLQAGDVVMVARGALKLALVGQTTAGAVLDGNLICVRPEPDLLMPEVLRAFLDLPETREQIRQQSGSTTGLPILKVETLRKLTLNLPESPTQQRIADLVRAFDVCHRASLELVEQRRLAVQAALRSLVSPCLGGI